MSLLTAKLLKTIYFILQENVKQTWNIFNTQFEFQ